MSRDAAYTFGLILLLASGSMGGLVTIAGKYAAIEQVDLTTLNLVRFVIAASVLWLVLPLAGLSMRLPRTPALGFMLLGAIAGLGIGYGNFGSLQYLPAGVTALLFYTFPAFVLVGAVLTGRETLTLGRVAALVLALAGCVLVVGSPGGGWLNPFGIGLALVAALTAAVHILGSERLLGGVNPLVATAHGQAGAAAAMLLVTAFVVPVNFAMTAQGALSILAITLLGNLLGMTGFIIALRRVGASVAAVGVMTEVVVTVALGVMLFSEYLGPDRVLGAALVLGGMFVMQREGRRSNRAHRMASSGPPGSSVDAKPSQP